MGVIEGPQARLSRGEGRSIPFVRPAATFLPEPTCRRTSAGATRVSGRHTIVPHHSRDLTVTVTMWTAPALSYREVTADGA
jgi:hypothetical protein